MFKIDGKKTIYLTRGDIATLNVTARNSDNSEYTFKKDDIVRFNVFEKGNNHKVVIKKDILIEEDTTIVNVNLITDDTRFGELISYPVDYWYEIIINPDTAPQTIVGYLDNPTVFRLLPEGGAKNE